MKKYQQRVEDVLVEVDSSIEGLSDEEAKRRYEKYGKNALEESKPKAAWIIFLEQYKDLMVIILIIAALISAISGEASSAIVILVVITLNAILGTIQTINAQKSLDALKKLSTPHTRVLRDGVVKEIDSSELTIGDVMMLEAGDVVGADARVIESYTLQVNESALTGEVEAVEKHSDLIEGEVALGDQKNMVFATSLVTYGRAKCVVCGIGMDSEIGKIASLMNETKERKTPLQRTLDDFSKKLSFLIIAICIVVFALDFYRNSNILDALMFAVALAVAAIPEALSSIVTIVLSMGTSQMAKENAIIKNINSVESLGCVSVICSDKTGTLTQNKMSAIHVYTNQQLKQANEINRELKADRHMMLAYALCSDATKNGEQRIGDPTELALVDLLEVKAYDEKALRNKYPRLDENPFDSDRKMMSTLELVDGHKTLMVKGACDEILKKTTHIIIDDEIVEISEAHKEAILKQNHAFAMEGLRVLGFAYRLMDDDCNTISLDDECNFIFLGLTSLMDPPRVESKDAVSDCLSAGIKPVMITGDHKVTATSIAKQIGIYQDGYECVDGIELDNMSDDELMARLENIRVYARVAPEHKIRIVKSWQKLGNIVAMTGDGVNDAPALKQADIGIAMGITGTEVSKDAASMILTDDNFATIVKAVAQGRNVYRNIKNSIVYLLSGNLSGIISVLCASLLALPAPFAAVHLLFINLVTDSLPAIAIGMEKSNKDILNEPPRDANEGILTKEVLTQLVVQGALIAIATMSAFFIGYAHNTEYAMTMAFSTLCLARLFHGFNCRGKQSIFKLGFTSNMASIAAFLVGIVLLASILFVPFLHGVFAVVPLESMHYLVIVGLALAPTLVIQLYKMIINK